MEEGREVNLKAQTETQKTGQKAVPLSTPTVGPSSPILEEVHHPGEGSIQVLRLLARVLGLDHLAPVAVLHVAGGDLKEGEGL